MPGFSAGNNQDEFRAVLPIITACNDPEALNYEPLSYNTDGCEYAEVDRIADLVATHQLEAYPSPAFDWVTVTFPDQFASLVAGAEIRALSLEGRLAKSWTIDGVTSTTRCHGPRGWDYVLTVSGLSDATLRFQGDLVITK